MEIITEIDFDFKFAFDNYKKLVSDFTKENLEGVDEALSNYNRPRVEKALAMVDEVLFELLKEKGKR